MTRSDLAQDLLSFAVLAPTAVSEQVLIDELMARIRPYGVSSVVAGVMTDVARNFKFGPRYGLAKAEWLEAYMTEQLYLSDPGIDFALHGVRGVYWDQAFDQKRLARGGQKVISVAREHGISDGFMAPVPLLNGDVVIVAFQGERLSRDPDVEAFFRGLAGYYGTEGHRLAVRSQLKSADVSCLTVRQLQIMHQVAAGKRNGEVAEALGISEATVNFHLGRIRERLGARTTREALTLLHATPREFFTP